MIFEGYNKKQNKPQQYWFMSLVKNVNSKDSLSEMKKGDCSKGIMLKAACLSAHWLSTDSAFIIHSLPWWLLTQPATKVASSLQWPTQSFCHKTPPLLQSHHFQFHCYHPVQHLPYIACKNEQCSHIITAYRNFVKTITFTTLCDKIKSTV